MESQHVPLITDEVWESLGSLCPQDTHRATIIEYLQSLTPEWQHYFSGLYPDLMLNLISRSSLTTGILQVNKDHFAYGAVLRVSIWDPSKYYTRLTRFIVIYMDANLEVSAICKSGIEPRYSEEFMYQGAVKK
jgi:hypothetical protein